MISKQAMGRVKGCSWSKALALQQELVVKSNVWECCGVLVEVSCTTMLGELLINMNEPRLVPQLSGRNLGIFAHSLRDEFLRNDETFKARCQNAESLTEMAL